MTRAVFVLAALLGTVQVAGAQQSEAVASTARRGWFGISLTCNDCVMQRAAGRVAYVQPPAVSSVESGSPAYVAGLRSGDTILTVDGMAITTPEGFERFASARPFVPIRLNVRKGGQEREVTVIPGERASARTIQEYYADRLRTAQRRGLEALRNSFRTPLGWLGMSVECEQCSVTTLGRRQQSWVFREPPAVMTVDVDGPAHRGGLRRGDTLTAIDGVDLTTSAGGRAFAQVEPGQRVTLTVRRDGRERRVALTAVARPDASREELAAYEEYRRARDSADAEFREMAAASMLRAQTEMREVERLMRDLDRNRAAIDSSRRHVATIDSLLRALRSAERERSGEMGSFAFPTPRPAPAPRAPMAPVAPVAPLAPVPPVPAVAPTPLAAYAYPIRYVGRLGDLVNIEARAPGGVNVQEVGDTLIVVTSAGMEVRIVRRAPVAQPAPRRP